MAYVIQLIWANVQILHIPGSKPRNGTFQTFNEKPASAEFPISSIEEFKCLVLDTSPKLKKTSKSVNLFSWKKQTDEQSQHCICDKIFLKKYI